MSFIVNLMNNTQELNKISKSPTSVVSLKGTLRKETSIVDPVIEIEYSGTLTNCNYAYIPEFHRYYFITNIESVVTGIWRVYMHCDVLKTYANGILGTPALVSRNEKNYNLNLNDSCFRVESKPRYQVANFPNKFDGESYVLVMKGAQYTTS